MFCLFIIFSLVPSLWVIPSFGLTESVELFGELNSIDLILNDVWMDTKNPTLGQPISVHASVYNAGIISSGDFTDFVSVAYFVNGELVEINLLKNIDPGIDNGIAISSGPIFDAVPGDYVVTVIINYHDTLSHLRDNLENNIIQKRFQIVDDKVPPLISFDVRQYYDPLTETQLVNVQGDLTNISHKTPQNNNVTIDIGGGKSTVFADMNGQFFLDTSIEFSDEPVKITASLENNPIAPSVSKTIFPLKLEDGQSALALEITYESESDVYENPEIVTILFRDSYDHLFKKISNYDEGRQDTLTEELIMNILPANHEYIGEIYLEGRLLDAFQSNFTKNHVVSKEILISDTAQIRFSITNEKGMPQRNIVVDNWIYSTISGDDGYTDWIPVIPTVTPNEPYVAKALFPDGRVTWSEPFLIEHGEKKVIKIIQGSDKK